MTSKMGHQNSTERTRKRTSEQASSAERANKQAQRSEELLAKSSLNNSAIELTSDLITLLHGLQSRSDGGSKKQLFAEFLPQFSKQRSEASFVCRLTSALDAAGIFPIQIKTVETARRHKLICLGGLSRSKRVRDSSHQTRKIPIRTRYNRLQAITAPYN